MPFIHFSDSVFYKCNIAQEYDLSNGESKELDIKFPKKYYDNKKQVPIIDKMDEVQKLLQDKPSIIYHSSINTSTDVKFNPIFIERCRWYSRIKPIRWDTPNG